MTTPTSRFTSKNNREAITSRLRLRDWDYRLPGPYFVTVLTNGRTALFGSVSDSTMALNPAGEMLDVLWHRIPDRYPNVVLDGFVVMPNHIHGIVTLDTDELGDVLPDAPSLSDVIRWFKIQSTMKYGDGVKGSGWPGYRDRLWQPGFMDHIIRNEHEMARLLDYIDANPSLWENDTFHSDANRPSS